ncbi:MAG: hypothetical protein MZV64_05185 [Ignavibacteriales bacterium]|nr:hypothetical protein [Ignavibacteriales bacterium]
MVKAALLFRFPTTGLSWAAVAVAAPATTAMAIPPPIQVRPASPVPLRTAVASAALPVAA